MDLLIPEYGLLFWMVLSFGIVVLILAKYGFPVIVKMVEERKTYIDESLLIAKQTYEQMAVVKAQGEAIMDEARREQVRIMKEAARTHDTLVTDAKVKATLEAEKIIEEARKQIQREKDAAVRDIRRQVAELSVDIAEKVLRGQLDNKYEQMAMIDRLLDEINISKS